MSDNKAWSNGGAGNSPRSGSQMNGGKYSDSGIAPVAPEFLRSFVGVVRSYLPEIQHEIEALYAHPQPLEPLAEAFRHLRSIKAASAMLGLTALSTIAEQFEQALQALAAGRVPLTIPTLISFSQLIALFNSYLERSAGGNWDDFTSLSEGLWRLQEAPEENELPRTTASLSVKLAPTPPPAAHAATTAPSPIPEPPLLAADYWTEQPPLPNAPAPPPPEAPAVSNDLTTKAHELEWARALSRPDFANDFHAPPLPVLNKPVAPPSFPSLTPSLTPATTSAGSPADAPASAPAPAEAGAPPPVSDWLLPETDEFFRNLPPSRPTLPDTPDGFGKFGELHQKAAADKTEALLPDTLPLADASPDGYPFSDLPLLAAPKPEPAALDWDVLQELPPAFSFNEPPPPPEFNARPQLLNWPEAMPRTTDMLADLLSLPATADFLAPSTAAPDAEPVAEAAPQAETLAVEQTPDAEDTVKLRLPSQPAADWPNLADWPAPDWNAPAEFSSIFATEPLDRLALENKAALDPFAGAAPAATEADCYTPAAEWEVPEELLEVFQPEAEEHLRVVADALTTLAGQPDNRTLLQEIRRNVHSLKGAAAVVGFRELSRLAHRMEDLLDLLYEGKLKLTPEGVQLLFTSTDALDDLLNQKVEPPTLQPLYHTYEMLIGDEKPASTAELAEFADYAAYAENGPTELFPSEAASAAENDEAPAPELDWEVPAELLEVFQPEAEEHLRLMSLSLPTLAAQPANKALLQEIRRSAHSLKGAAAIVGFQEMARLAHRSEDLLDLLYEDELPLTPERVQLLLASTDALEDLLNQKADAQTLHRLYAAYEQMLPKQEPRAQTSKPAAPQPFAAEPGSLAAAAETVLGLSAGQEPSATRESLTLAQPEALALVNRGRHVRVPIEKLDDVVKLVTELIISRATFEQNMTQLTHQLEELRASSLRLGQVATRMEVQFEASTLGGGLAPRRALPGTIQTVLTSGRAGVNGLLSAVSAPASTHGFDDLELDRYTEFHLLLRGLTEAHGDIQTLDRELGAVKDYFESCLNRQSRLCSDIQDQLMRLRMVPLATLAARLHRTARTVAQQRHKLVNFVIEGEETRLDKTVIEEMADPLLHILRNAIDHGLENPTVRQAVGKAPTGLVRLRAFHEGTQTVIQISDDGSGLHPEKLRQTAINHGYLAPGDAARMNDDELFALIFLPGFSTAPEVSEISGRGVGMDVVKSTIHRLKGSVRVESRPGEGTTFSIRLPMTLAVMRALLVKNGGQTYAIPLAGLQQVVKLTPKLVERLGQEQIVRFGGKVYPLLQLSKLLNLRRTGDSYEGLQTALLMSLEERQVAIVVDETLSGREIVVKTLGNHLRQVRGITGATLMGDGSAVLILNLPELTHDAFQARLQPLETRVAARARAAAARKPLSVLIVDDSLSVRRVLANRITSVGWKALQAKDGLDALEMLPQLAAAPDIVLADIEMPRMDGYEFISALRKQRSFAHLPIIVITSRAGQKHREKAFEVGATEYLIKPYQDEVLLNLIRRLTSERERQN